MTMTMKNQETAKEETKKPYNIRPVKEKAAAYRSLIRAELADELVRQNYRYCRIE